MADFGCRVNHVKRLMSSCLQNLYFFEFPFGVGLPPCTPPLHSSPLGVRLIWHSRHLAKLSRYINSKWQLEDWRSCFSFCWNVLSKILFLSKQILGYLKLDNTRFLSLPRISQTGQHLLHFISSDISNWTTPASFHFLGYLKLDNTCFLSLSSQFIIRQ